MPFHQAIYVIENEIKNELDIHGDISEKKYYPFGLVNQGLYYIMNLRKIKVMK